MPYLQLMNSYAPAWGFGGPTRMMYDYARWMADDARGAHVIAGDVHHDYSANLIRTEFLDGISIRRVPVWWRSLVSKSLNCVSPRMLAVAFWQVRASPQITVLHVGEFRSPVFLYAVVLRHLFPSRVRLVHSAFGQMRRKVSSLRRCYDTLFMGLMMRSLDVGLAQNEHEMQVYQEFFAKYEVAPKRLEFLPLHNCLPETESDVSEDDLQTRRIGLREKLNLPRNATICMFLGRLNPAKGIIRAIDAFLQFSKMHGSPSVLLVIGRDDGFQAQVEAHIAVTASADSIQVITNVYEGRFEYYECADMFIGFPLIFEETMLSAVEALGCGTPVLVSREADMPFLEQGGAGFVIDYATDTAAVHMRKIAADLPAFRRGARTVSRRNYSESAARMRFKRIIQSIAHDGSGKAL